MEPTPRTSFDALLEESGWARRLAQSLVRDAHAADDLVQRAWLAALRHPPSDGTPPRRWLANVLRNLARTDARESGRRRARESDVARPVAMQPESGDVEDRIALQERLLGAVRELPEPSRSTVWARYGEGLAPRAIARRDGVPIKTVRTRLARGLEMLRARFDREHGGDRRAWVALLLPLADPDPLAAVTVSTILMDTKLKIAAVLALVACGTGVWFAVNSGDVSPAATTLAVAPPSVDEPEPQRVEPQVAVAEPDAARVALGAQAAPPAAAPAPAVVVRHGIVIDLEQRPVAGLEILDGWQRKPIVVDGVSVKSDGRGRFTVLAGRGYVTARGPGWITVYATQSDLQEARDEVCVVVARERTIIGSVVDAAGKPVVDAVVEQHLVEGARLALGDKLRGPVEITFTTRTDENGLFSLDAPDSEARLDARAENHRPGSKVVPSGPLDQVVIVLPAPEATAITLRGRVVDLSGAGVERATVVLAGTSVKSSADGAFELAVPREALDNEQRTTRDGKPPTGPMPLVLRAGKPGHLPAERVLPVLEDLERVAPHETWRLELGGPPLAIAGRVVDSDGKPVEGARVDLLDEQPFGKVDVEFGDMSLSLDQSIESFLRGGDETRPTPLTGADGRFEIGGLQPRAYRLDVIANSIPAARTTEPILAGAKDIEVALDTGGPRSDLDGRLVDRRGEPLAGLRVNVSSRLPGYEDLVRGPSADAGASGHFAFHGVRGGQFRLEVGGPDFVTTWHDVKPQDRLDDIVVTVARRAYVQVDLGDRPDFADKARLLDRAGEPILLNITRTTVGDSSSSSIAWGSNDLPIQGGRSEVGSTAECECTCVLFKGGEEVARIPVRLDGIGVTVVRP